MSPVHAARSAADRYNADSLNEVIARINGDAMLRPTNRFLNWHFADVDEEGDPEGMEIVMPEDPEGWFVYLSEKNKGPDTIAAQNTDPIPIEQVSHVFDEAWVGGHAPATPDTSFPIAPPGSPGTATLLSTQGGFKAGRYWVTYSFADKKKKHTTVAPAIDVVVLQGQVIRVSTPSADGEEVAYIGFWLSEVDKGPETVRLQKVIDVRRKRQKEVVLKGFNRKGRRAPSKNETIRKAPRTPSVSTVPSSQPMRSDAGGQTGGGNKTFQARAVNVNENGRESGPSSFSESVVVSGSENVNVRITPDFGNVISENTETKQRVYVSVNGKEHVAYDSTKGSQNQTVGPKRSVDVSGATRDNASPGERGRLAPSSPAAQEEEEIVGIEDPTSELEQPIAEGKVVLEPGTYWVGCSYYVRGKETVVSPLKKETFSTGRMLRIIFPDPVNEINNPYLAERDANGDPLDHTLVKGLGDATATEEGEVLLNTIGPKLTTEAAPSHSMTFVVDRAKGYVVGETVEANMIAGTFRAALEELDDTGAVIRTTILKDFSASGTAKAHKIMGPGGTDWADGTVEGRIVNAFRTTATRNGTVKVWNFLAHRGLKSFRRRVLAPPGSRDPADTNPPKDHPHKRGSSKGTEKPPSTIGRLSPQRPIDAVDFGTGAIPNSWTLRRSTVTGTVSAVTTAAAVDAPYGYNISKATSSTAYVYLYRSFDPTDRGDIAVRCKVRVRQLPTRQTVSLVQIKQGTLSNDDGDNNGLAAIKLQNDGALQYHARVPASDRVFTFDLASGVRVGDVLDIELLITGAGTSKGYVLAAIGKNGQTRSFATRKGPYNWQSGYARTVQVGVSRAPDPAAKWNLDFDTIRVTETGDSLGSGGSALPLEPLELPDRPYRAPVPVEAETTFGGGAIPGTWPVTRTPSDSTTVSQAGTSYAINGTHGVRVSDTGTTTNASVYLERTLASARESLGLRARLRVVGRPSTGEVQLMGLYSGSNEALAIIYLTSTGEIFARAFEGATGLTATKIAQGITNGTTLTLELVAEGAGTEGGRISAWYSPTADPLGSIADRSLLYQEENVNWSTQAAQKARVGGYLESSAASTFSLDVDSILLTEEGEVLFSEQTEDGTDVNQVQMHLLDLPEGIAARDDLGPRGLREAVEPGQEFTIAVKARFADVQGTAFLFYFVAYDLSGNLHELGSVINSGNGISGTLAWQDHQRTFTVPENCYEVRMESRDIAGGEFVFQEFAFCDGPGPAVREVSFPASGTIRHTLDTQAMRSVGVTDLDIPSPGARWLDVGAVMDVPEGCAASASYQSAETYEGPWSPLTNNPGLVPQRRLLRCEATLQSDPTRKRTPVLRSGAPFVEEVFSRGTLLTADRQELPGGVDLYNITPWIPRERVTLRELRSGRTSRHRSGEAVGILYAATLRCYTKQAAEYLQTHWLLAEWVIEVPSLRQVLRVRPKGPEEGLDIPLESGLRWTGASVDAIAHGEFRVDVGPFDVYEASPQRVNRAS